MRYFFDGFIRIRNNNRDGLERRRMALIRPEKVIFDPGRLFFLWSSEPEGEKGSCFFVCFFPLTDIGNMSVLPTNAAVFYVIFIDKDVDKF